MSKINIAPLNFSNRSVLFEIKKRLEAKLIDVGLIDLSIDHTSAFSKDRNQYYSTKLLAESIKRTDDVNGKVILLVDFDLFVPVFTFVFGEAQLNGKHSIVSLCRLHEEFYTGDTNEPLLIERSLKEIFHELGHNFGLVHCKDWECVMHVSNIIEEVDIKGDFYCNDCFGKIDQSYFNFNTANLR